MQLRWIHFTAASDSKVSAGPSMVRDGSDWEANGSECLQRESPEGPLAHCSAVYLNQKVNVVIFKHKRGTRQVLETQGGKNSSS